MQNPTGSAAPASDAARGWRVGHQGRDRMYYEERHGWSWERIEIDGEMLMGPAHHVIYFPSPDQWLRHPSWAQGRRDEIIARIKSEFRPPDYEYHGDAPGAPPSTARAPAASGPRPPAPARGPTTPVQGRGALLLAVILLFGLAAGMGWVVVRGLTSGQTRLPIKQATLRRPVERQQEPATYWLAIGVYAAVGAGALTLGGLGARAWRRLGR